MARMLTRVDPTALITEKAFQQAVMDQAKLDGWLGFHPWTSIHSPAGFPDCCFVRGPRLILAELKTEKGKLTPAQREWRDRLSDVPVIEYYLWRPSDWTAIIATLARP